MADAFLEFDLFAEVQRLQAEPTGTRGQNARTLVKFDDLRVVLTTLRAHERMPEHKTAGRLSIHVLSGHVHVKAAGRTFNLSAGRMVALDRAVPHDVEALQDSALLLTIAWPGRE